MSKTALIEAVKRLDLPAAKRLFDSKPEFKDVTDRQGRNLLHMACAASPAMLKVPYGTQVRLVDALLQRGFEIDMPYGKDKVTPLFIAVARARNPALVKFLLARGASVKAAPGGGLFAAAWWNDVTNLKLLVGAGATIDVEVGVTPFLAAWTWRQFAAAKYLALQGADLDFHDRKGRTALHWGIEKEFDPKLLAWLVKHGASPEKRDREGVTARERASRKRDKRFLAALG
jgi:ankyrin repeat protein